MTPMAQAIVDYVKTHRGTSFAELERHIEGFSGTNALLFKNYPNLVLWTSVSDAGCEAFQELLGVTIEPTSCDPWVYLIDGKIPTLPVALKVHNYKAKRWLPVVFNLKPEKKR